MDHLVYISIVGIDRIPYSYYRAKLRVEEMIASSGVAHSILRATQFHELMELGLASMVAAWRELRGRLRRTVRVPLPGATARTFRQGFNTCPERAVGTITWRQFLTTAPSGEVQ